nr:MAG TPA: conjugal transfer protein [Caudoviricetes sp.]
MKVYKGTNKDMKCRGFQYKLGETAVFDGEPHLCEAGLHACEQPIDVLNHYAPNESRYFEADAEEVTDEREPDDSKIVAKKMTLKAEIGVPGLVKAQIEYIKNQIGFDDAIKRANAEKENHATGDQGAASATGDQGAASATGNRGAASATGNQGAASATGYLGAASATGNQGAASATGYQGAASATGNRGAASATGDLGAASATGYQGAASATGYQGAASATGKAGVALAAGLECKAMGALGCAICCVERGEWDGETYPIIAVKAAIVDGEKIKAGTWYQLKSGEFVEVE